MWDLTACASSRHRTLQLGRDLVLALHPFRDAAALAPLWAEAHGTASRGGHAGKPGRASRWRAEEGELLASAPWLEEAVEAVLGEEEEEEDSD